MRNLISIAALVILIACEAQCGGAMQQTNGPAGDRRFTEVKHVNFPCDVSYMSTRFETVADWKSRVADLREQVLAGAGLLPMPVKTPLNARVFGRIDRGDYTVEKVYFESHPGFFVTGNLYRPKGNGPFPAVVIPHGHCENGRLESTDNSSYPGLCIGFARQGYAAFSYDMIGYVDSTQILEPGDEKGALHCNGSERSVMTLSSRKQNLWGISLGGLQLWNSIRAVDFVQSLPDVDKDRIAATGHSGGGTQTFLLSAVDERVKVCAPVVMISAHMQGGCRCENVPNLRIDTDNVEIASLTAPRPMMMVSASGDWTKDTPKVEFPATQAIYKLFGASEKVANVHIDAEHNYNKASREAVYSWFGQWLPKKPLPQPVREAPFEVERPEDLRVFPDGKLPSNALDAESLTAQIVSDSNAQLQSYKPTDAAGLLRLRKTYAPALRRALSIAPVAGVEGEPGEVTDGAYYSATEISITDKSRGAAIPAVLYAPLQAKPGESVVMVYARGMKAFEKRNHEPGNLASWLINKGRRVLLIDCFATGTHTAPEGAPARSVDTDFFETYNRTDLAEHVSDILVASEYLRNRADVTKVSMIGMGKAGLWCLLARPFAPKVARLAADAAGLDISDDDTFTDSLYAPCLRRAGDVRTAMALSAPEKTSIINTKGTFDTSWATAAYAVSGEPDALCISRDYPSDSDLAKWLCGEE